MYTKQKNVQVLLSLLKQNNIRYAVISPGGRNIPLVRSLEQDPSFTCYSVVDERSAVYFAIGLSTEKNATVLLSCTSAQATRNYLPGMTEAFYRGTPLVVVTADYKPSLIGQGTMQAIEQMSVPKDAAKYSVKLPMVKDLDDEKYCARLVNEALLELNHHGTGPVHIDIPTDELWAGGAKELPVAKKIERLTANDSLPKITANKILISIGQHLPFTKDQSDALEKFAKKYSAVIYTNHLSNYHGPRSVNGNLLLESLDYKTFAEYKPDLLITIGGQIGDYAFDARFKDTSNFEHWRVHEDGAIKDNYGCLTKVFELPIKSFFNKYSAMDYSPRGNEYFDLWSQSALKVALPTELPLSHAFVASVLSKKIPKNSLIHYAILSSLRNWSFFNLDPSITGYSNVAAFGIDGCLSTFIGASVSTDKKSFLIIGDLSFFYDMNAIGIRHIKNNARIVLINNKGGGEFRLFSHAASEFGEEANRHIAAMGHHGSAQAWAESMGWSYIGVNTKEDLINNADTIVGDSEKPILVEVHTTMHDDSEGVRQMVLANNRQSAKVRMMNKVSPRMKRSVKKILKR